MRATRPRSRARQALIAAVVIAAATAGALRLARGRPTLDANRVMIFPLVLPGDWPGSRTSGEDVATIVGSAMDGAGALRWVDGWQLLKPSQRENIRLLAVNEAMAISRAQRCAYAITGRLVARGDSADVFLELIDVRGDSVISRPPGTSSLIGESWRAGLSAVTAILPRLIPTATPDVDAEWQARPPQAVAHFLLGEAAFRRLRLRNALAEFQKAIAADSSFGVAAIRGAMVASWDHQPSEAASLVRVAGRRPLSPRYRLFAAGLDAYLDGRADTAAARFRAAIALDSSMTAAWQQLGEVYVHLLPAEGFTDSFAEAAFERARALDSTAASSIYHLVELYARRGDQSGAAALGRRFIAKSADTMLTREVELVSACRSDGFRNVDLREWTAHRAAPLVITAKLLGASTATSRCARQAYEVLLREDTARTDDADGRRFYSLLGLTNSLLSHGRAGDAVAILETFQRRWKAGSSLYLQAATVFPALADSARAVARRDSVRAGWDYKGIRFPVRLWLLGVWSAHDGRPATATAVAGDLAARSARGTRFDSLLASSMAGHAALAHGDSLLALRRFAELIGRASPASEVAWNEPASLGYDRLLLGRLLVWHEEFARALGVLEVHDSAVPAVYPLYARASLELRAQAATALGDDSRAAALRARLRAIARN